MKIPNELDDKLKLLEEDLAEGKIKFKEKLYTIYAQEFEEKIQNILLLKETDYMYQYLNRMKLIIEDLYSNEAYEYSLFVQVCKEIEKIIYEEAYKKSFALLSKGWIEYEKAIAPPKVDNKHFRKSSMENKSSNKLSLFGSGNINANTVIYLKSFRKHCKQTDFAIHKCKGKFLPIFNEKRDITHVICVKCKFCYFSTSILMYCNACDVEYYSCHITNFNKNYEPATWEKYHCGAIINDQMHCIKCKDLFYINLIDGRLTCLKCKFEADAGTILWNCMLCRRDFKSNAKIYNPMEFKIIKIAIKNTILAKIPASPISVPCCKVNVKYYKFFHKGECRGYLYQGEISGKKIIVCSKCKMMTNFEKFLWTCPVCLKRFKQKDIDVNDLNQVNQNEFQSPEKIDYMPLQTEENDYQFSKNLNQGRPPQQRDISVGKKGKNISFSIKEEEEELQNVSVKNLKSITPSKKNFSIVNPVKKIEVDLSNASNSKYNSKTPNKKPESHQNNINLSKSSNVFYKNSAEPSSRASESKVSNYNNYLVNNPKASPKRDEDDELLSREVRPGTSMQNYKKTVGLVNCNKPLEINLNAAVMRSGVVNINQINPTPRVERIPEFSLDEQYEAPKETLKELQKELQKETQSPTKTPSKQDIHGKINLNQNPNVIHIKNPYEIETSKLKEFNFEEYNVITQIGEGSFGKIYLVEDKLKNIYSMKKIIANDDVDLEMFQSEYELVNLVRHPNIMRILAMCKRKLDYTTHVLYILMEVGLTDWEKEIKSRQSSKNSYTEKELINILKELVSALAFLQTRDISHRDIKPQNILLFKNNVFKVADFGEAKQISKMETNKQLSTLRGTELYMSPLLFNALRTNQNDIKHNSFRSDVFSLAFCLIYAASLNIYVLYELRKVYDTKSILQILNKYFKNKLSDQFIKILEKMLDINEENRYDFLELEEVLKDIE